MIKKLIEIERFGKTPLQRNILTRCGFLFEKSFSIDKINSLYSHVSQASGHAGFLQSSLTSLGVSFNLSPRDLASIPLKGPTVVVANHPFGALDGIVLGTIFTSLRRDVKILGNYLLKEIPELKDLVIAVDPFGVEGSARNNVKPLLEAVRWLRNGGMLLVFPGRQVSHLRITEGGVSDATWSPTVAGLIRQSEATVSPVYFAGRNSFTF